MSDIIDKALEIWKLANSRDHNDPVFLEAIATLPPARPDAPHPYTLRPDLQRIVEGSKTAPQWDLERDRLAPAQPDTVEALVKAAEADPRVNQLEAEIKALADACDCECDDDDCVRCSHYPAILEQKRAALAAIRAGGKP